MNVIDGIVTIVQESRFQLVDDRGVAHTMILGHASLAEPDQLEALARRQSRVRVRWTQGQGVIGSVARTIEIL